MLYIHIHSHYNGSFWSLAQPAGLPLQSMIGTKSPFHSCSQCVIDLIPKLTTFTTYSVELNSSTWSFYLHHAAPCTNQCSNRSQREGKTSNFRSQKAFWERPDPRCLQVALLTKWKQILGHFVSKLTSASLPFAPPSLKTCIGAGCLSSSYIESQLLLLFGCDRISAEVTGLSCSQSSLTKLSKGNPWMTWKPCERQPLMAKRIWLSKSKLQVPLSRHYGPLHPFTNIEHKMVHGTRSKPSKNSARLKPGKTSWHLSCLKPTSVFVWGPCFMIFLQ